MGQPRYDTNSNSSQSSNRSNSSNLSDFNQFLKEYQKQIKQYAGSFGRSHPYWKDDFCSAGTIALWEAYKKYKEAGIPFIKSVGLRTIFNGMVAFYRQHIQR